MNWYRIFGIVAGTLFCIGTAAGIWSDVDAPRSALALAGALMIPVVVVAVCGLILAWFFVTEVLRPSVRCRKPVVPMALATREASLVGRRRYRMHPVDFWAVLTFGNRLAFGLMVFGKIHHIAFNEDDTHNPSKGD